MIDLSVYIGGKAGDGIGEAGLIIARILSRLGYYIYIYYDYPSLIRGGHNFSIIRASVRPIACHLDKVDFMLALNQDCIDLGKDRFKKETVVIYDSKKVKTDGLGIPIDDILKEENGLPIMRNTCIIGALCKTLGIDRTILESVLNKSISKEIDLNLKIAKRGYDASNEVLKIEKINNDSLPVITGNEAIGLGLLNAGLKAYISYPMTPSSSILHFLAKQTKNFPLKVIHPESEIAVILMALGFAYAGKRVAVGTSGGGFCLMTEALSLSGMAELPIVIIVSQRTGPSTGLPTYTAQGDLSFVLSAGQGEFIRFVASPGDPEEAYFWSAIALNISWKFQVPSIILVDKTLSEGSYSFNLNYVSTLQGEESVLLWDGKQPFKRYLNTSTGISPLAFPSQKNAVIKVNSYEHDEFGITTEDVGETVKMQNKRLGKEKYIIEELEKYETVKTYGDLKSSKAVICWGSNKGVCVEAAEKFGLKVIHPLVLSPLPVNKLRKALSGVNTVVCVESNATGQFAKLINGYGLKVNKQILKYDGRPFSLEELTKELEKVV